MSAGKRKIRVGLVGAGWVAGARHYPLYARDPRVHVVAVCDRHRERAEYFARKRGIPYATARLDEFFAYGLDLVSICTPPFAHAEVAHAALSSGAHVFLEKPMALSTAEAAAIAAAAQASGKLLCVSHNFLFSRSLRRIRHRLASGIAGAVQFAIGVQASSPQRRLPAWYGDLPGGLFFDEAPHLLYLLASLLGPLSVEHVTAIHNAPNDRQPVRSLHVVLRTPTAPATLTMSFAAPISEWHLVLVCEREVLAVDLFRDVSIILDHDGAHKAWDIMRTSAIGGLQHVVGVASSGTRLVLQKQYWGHDQLIAAVVQAVCNDQPSPVPLEDALHVMQVMDAIVAALD